MRKVAVFAVAFIILIASCSKKSVPTVPKIDAAAVFQNNCARCHGATGTEGRAPNLSTIALSKPELIEVITKGKGHMPPFADKLSDKEIEAVATFVTGLKK